MPNKVPSPQFSVEYEEPKQVKPAKLKQISKYEAKCLEHEGYKVLTSHYKPTVIKDHTIYVVIAGGEEVYHYGPLRGIRYDAYYVKDATNEEILLDNLKKTNNGLKKEMEREELLKVFEDTKAVVEDRDLRARVKGFDEYSEVTVKGVEMELENYAQYDPTHVLFEKMDTISAAIKYAKRYMCDTPCVDFLVFASSKHYGGGVWTGAKAQEEDIFRCTDLYLAKEEVEKDYYPLTGTLAVDCHIIKDRNFNELDNEIAARAFFAAAPNLNKKMNDPKLDVDFRSRMLCLTDATLNYSSDTTLIIGAWGCGVFKNDPKEVAGLFKTIMPLLLDDYKQVVVAIPDEKLLNIFKEVLQSATHD